MPANVRRAPAPLGDTRRRMVDWDKGRYEETAAELEPVAVAVVAMAAPRAGDRLLDIACGTGNGVLLAAARGADVVGVDTAPRLVAVARERAAAAGLSPELLVGDALAVPVTDGSFDIVISIFGVIFVSDPARAMAEVARVLRPGGRAYVTAWVPAGPINDMLTVLGRAIGRATGGAQPARPSASPGRRPTASGRSPSPAAWRSARPATSSRSARRRPRPTSTRKRAPDGPGRLADARARRRPRHAARGDDRRARRAQRGCAPAAIRSPYVVHELRPATRG